ncbi:MAG: M14 family metallocarboxypeptidase [Asticcacaulis sp.]|uniref:M14 family metallopeptidase n=1 Tax=Asticcacaulis sp. TaxID=1872648 RepID=UPI0039E5DC73
MTTAFYPIGTPGTPWGDTERDTWRRQRTGLRSYTEDVLPRIESLSDRFDVSAYGALDYNGETYTLYAVRSLNWNPALPVALVTGGVHGYETSGVMGALQFLETEAARYAGRINLLVAPCVSPWGYERINRWNYDAIDPNRNFRPDGPARESTALIELVAPLRGQFLMHIDLHETTDSDESEFRPALAARDGKDFIPDTVPDGFYLVDDSEHPQPEFQQAIIAAVARVTHIAPPDASGHIIGCPVVAHGVIEYPVATYAMCTGITGAPYTTTTEVYPDSPTASPKECNDAQVAAVCAAIDYVLVQG